MAKIGATAGAGTGLLRPLPDRLIAIALALVSAIFLWRATAPWPATPDGLFHLQRVRALSEALVAGVLYPRWFPDFAFGYGYPVFNYYAPAFYYPPAMLHLLGLDIIDATRFTLALIYALGGVGGYLLLRRWTAPLPALAGAVLYQVFPYRLYDLFVRGALPEFAAFLWLPWIVLAALHVLDRWNRSVAPLAPANGILLIAPALCWAGLILTHNLTAFMAAVGLLIAWPLVAMGSDASTRRGGIDANRPNSHSSPVSTPSCERVDGTAAALADADAMPMYPARLLRSGWQLLAPLALAGLLSAWYILPAILEAGWVGLGAAGTSNGYANHFAAVGALFDWSWRFPYPDAAAPTVPLPAYVLVALVAGVTLALLAPGKERRARAGQKTVLIWAVMTGVAIWLTTAASAFLWDLLAPVMSNLQFPWRWQTLVGLGTAALATLAIALLPFSDRWRRGLALAVLMAVTVYGLAGLPTASRDTARPEITAAVMWSFDREMGQVGATWAGEFLPQAVTEPRWAIGREPAESVASNTAPGAALRMQPRKAGYLDRTYATKSEEAITIRFQRFYFPAWEIRLDGDPLPTAPTGSLGLLSINLPPGEHVLTLRWRPTAANQAGRVLAGLSWLLALWFIWAGRKAHRRLQMTAWLAAGAIGLLSMSGMTARTLTPTAVDADFGPVRLEAASVRPSQAGTVAPVRLYWTVQRPTESLTAFVHVVDAGGNIVAQQDEPLAGFFMPAARWTPGLVLEHEHAVTLPDDLPPGAYSIKAGVYPPGQPAAPLWPDGGMEPRVDIGQLAVQP